MHSLRALLQLFPNVVRYEVPVSQRLWTREGVEVVVELRGSVINAQLLAMEQERYAPAGD